MSVSVWSLSRSPSLSVSPSLSLSLCLSLSLSLSLSHSLACLASKEAGDTTEKPKFGGVGPPADPGGSGNADGMCRRVWCINLDGMLGLDAWTGCTLPKEISCRVVVMRAQHLKERLTHVEFPAEFLIFAGYCSQ